MQARFRVVDIAPSSVLSREPREEDHPLQQLAPWWSYARLGDEIVPIEQPKHTVGPYLALPARSWAVRRLLTRTAALALAARSVCTPHE